MFVISPHTLDNDELKLFNTWVYMQLVIFAQAYSFMIYIYVK